MNKHTLSLCDLCCKKNPIHTNTLILAKFRHFTNNGNFVLIQQKLIAKESKIKRFNDFFSFLIQDNFSKFVFRFFIGNMFRIARVRISFHALNVC
jgi:hypothetical protein